MARRPPTPEICPVCGDDVPPRALACPECGADHNSGWREGALLYDGLNLPDVDEDEYDDANPRVTGSYDEFMRREFGPKRELRPLLIKCMYWVAAVLLLLSFLFYSGLGALLFHMAE